MVNSKTNKGKRNGGKKMPICAVCGEESEFVTNCKMCGEKFCVGCGDADSKLCYFCDDGDEEDDHLDWDGGWQT